MKQNITLIYVIYKSGEIFFENIKGLKNFKKIVIDNDPDSVLENKIKKIDSTIDYTRLDFNIGMAKAANLAFNKVKTDFFLYLTADTVINEQSINNLLKIFFKYETIGLSCPVHLGLDNSYLGNYSCHPTYRFLKRKGIEKKIFKSLSKLLPLGDFSVNTVWGAPILLRTSLIKKIGFFDNNFFMYFEDVDLCDRIKDAGFEIIETPSSFCFHHKGISNIGSFKSSYIAISSFKFSEIYYFSKFGYKYTLRIYLHSLDYILRIFLNIFLFNKNKIFTNIFRLIGVVRFLFYKKKSKF
jgi:N-acetylglucosaminyl-diphospho-decaprenol L-rhamnosyltransferase